MLKYFWDRGSWFSIGGNVFAEYQEDIVKWMALTQVVEKQFMENFICIVKTMVSWRYTEDNEYVYGECYRYSGSYCEMDGVYTDAGETVYGEVLYLLNEKFLGIVVLVC